MLGIWGIEISGVVRFSRIVSWDVKRITQKGLGKSVELDFNKPL